MNSYETYNHSEITFISTSFKGNRAFDRQCKKTLRVSLQWRLFIPYHRSLSVKSGQIKCIYVSSLKIWKDIIGFCESGGKLTLQLLSSDENFECVVGPSIYKLGAFACRDYSTGMITFSKIALSYL